MTEYKPFGELTKDEQDQLKTAHLLGIEIEIAGEFGNKYYVVSDPLWNPRCYYRVKPTI